MLPPTILLLQLSLLIKTLTVRQNIEYCDDDGSVDDEECHASWQSNPEKKSDLEAVQSNVLGYYCLSQFLTYL